MKKIFYTSILIWASVLLSTALSAQSFTMGAAGGTINSCTGTILDPGGTGDYTSNLDVFQTICSGTGECVSLTFTSFGTEACCDELTIYEGLDQTGTVLGVYAGATNPGVVTGTSTSNGCITLYFNSDVSITNTGFSADISCVPCPPVITMGAGGSPTITGCAGVIVDPGGGGNYAANENVTQTICSGTADCISLSFTEFATEAGVDVLNVYDGSTTAGSLIGQFSGNASAGQSAQCSNVSGGCMTLEFVSDGATNLAGFRANFGCVPCEPAPIILGQGNASVNACSGTILDPGGTGNYPNNASVVQTICSANGTCVRLQFTSFATEATFDRLRVYDGPTTTSELLGSYSGLFNIPAPVESSTASGGCMTLEFTTNGSVGAAGFEAVISCVPCNDPVIIPTGFCDDALPFCSQDGQTFPAATGVQSEFGTGIGCLGSTPNPAWYFLRVENSGPIDMQITAASDIDFICWGPFTESEWQNGVCNTILDPVWADDNANIIDCSYSGTNNEDFVIPNALAGEYYAVLITNFSNQAQDISFTQDNPGTGGSTDCSILCTADVTGGPSACDPATNTYTVTGTVTLTNPPNSGTMTVINSSGGFDSYNAPFPSPVAFNYINIASDGLPGDITVQFSDDGTCVSNVNYIAPAACSSCPVSASASGPACEGGSVTLNASNVANGQYSWTGPNGFTSTSQSPQLTNITMAMGGVYTVTALNPMNGCSAIASVNVFVFAIPAAPVISNNTPICEGTPLNLTCDPVPGAIYTWAGPNAFTSAVQNPIIASASIAADGIYRCTITVNNCVSPESTTTVTINPYPTTPVTSNNGPLCSGDDLQLDVPAVAGATYEWKNPAGVVFSAVQSPTINGAVVAQSGNYILRVQVAGCWSLPDTTVVQIFPIPATPAPVSNSPVCQFAEITITGPNPLPIVGTIYAWTGPNAFSSATQNISILDAQQIHAGQYNLVITENGCSSASGSVSVVVTDIPISNAGADITICSNEPGQIGAAPVAGYSYSWNPALGLDFSTISNPTVTISNLTGNPKNETYVVTTSESGCSSKDTIVITINPQPIANFVAPNPQCFGGNSSDFLAEGVFSSNATFQWDFGPWASPDTSILANPQDVTFNSTGIQLVSLIINDRGCNSNTYQAPVMIYKMPVANFTSDLIVGCSPEVVKFTNLSEGSTNNSIKTNRWTFGNGKTSSSVNADILYNSPGVYDITLTVTNERGCIDTYTINDMIRINPSPKADFSLEPPVVYIVDPVTEIYNYSTEADEIYYIISSGDTIYQADLRYEFPDTGTYEVRQIVKTALGCSDSLSRPAIVQYGYKLYVPTAFTPNADGYNDVFRAYGEDVAKYEISIFNRWGELQYTSFDMENGWDGTIRLSKKTAPGGVYIYKIRTVSKNGLVGNYEGTIVLLR
jgi:gliding motility-associated-like protein